MNKAKVLYIDDETELLDLAAVFFEDESVPIETCSNIQDAVKLIKKNSYDLIISDASMPSGNCHDLFKRIRTEGLFDGKIVLVTGDIEEYHEGHKNNYDIILYKPIKFQELIEEVKGLLSEKLEQDRAVIRPHHLREDTGFFNL